MLNNRFNLDYFLNYNLWEDAIKLNNFQIRSMESNKHFKTLNLIYFKKILDKYENVIDSKKYFKEKIANNFFYGLKNEFFSIEYAVPKNYFGIRKYHFFSYPLRTVHYCIGLYILNLSQEFISTHIKANKNIHSYYGGDLKFQDGNIVLKNKDIYFLNYYKEYRDSINKEKEKPKNKFAIKLDIENYFDNLSVKRMLKLLEKHIKPSKKSELKFDTNTIELINFFYNYITKNETGIPQADNDIISSYLGYLYLCFSDLLIDDKLNKIKEDLIEEFNIYRYMDDIYIIVKYEEEDEENLTHTLKIAAKIRDLIYKEFNLKINNKTKILNLEKKNDKQEFTEDLKTVSSGYNINLQEIVNSEKNEENENHPQNKLDIIFEELKKLKELKSDIDLYKDDSPINEEIFKEIYNKNVQDLIKKEENKEIIQTIFQNFNFDLVKIKPIEILILILNDKESTKKFIDHFYEKEYLTINDINLIIKFYCKNDQSHKLLDKLKTKNNIGEIVKLIDNPEIDINKPGYCNLKFSKTKLIQEKISIIKQIELRKFNEKKENYSVALNHLVNEIHSICYYYENEVSENICQIKNYDANDVCNLLKDEGISNTITIQIENLFDRRNNNGISHSGTDEAMFSGVSKNEYNEYKGYVEKCIEQLLI